MPFKKIPLLLSLCGSLSLFGVAQAQGAQAPVCVHDESVKERFLPVELFTGSPMPAVNELVMVPVDRTYTFSDELPDGSLAGGDVTLKGPVEWQGQGGKNYEVYERKVPRAFERYAMTADRTGMGRVFDQRIGNITNEGKYPIGMWTQGQKRTYATYYEFPRGTRYEPSHLEIEKLSCVWQGIPGAMQYGYKTSGSSYGYVYAPGKGLVHVMTRVRAN